MSEFKGTKGKWKYLHSESKDAWNVIGAQLGSRYKIARCPYLQNIDFSIEYNEQEKTEQKANALLISKAPEMLELLNKVKFYAEVHGMQSDLYNEIEQLIKQATEI